MKKIAYKEMFDNELSHSWYIATRELLVDNLKQHLSNNSKILDVGCGTGGTIVFLKKHGYKKIYGIDKSPIAVKYCKKRKLKNITIGDINSIKYPSNSFDAVICLDVLYHKGVHSQKALKEIKRVLKKDGIFYSQEPAYNVLKSSHDEAIETERRFSKDYLENLFSKSKFIKIKLSYYNFINLFPIAALRFIKKFYMQERDKSDVSKLPSILNMIMLFILRIERIAVKHIDFPVGLSIVSVWKK